MINQDDKPLNGAECPWTRRELAFFDWFLTAVFTAVFTALWVWLSWPLLKHLLRHG